jgi:hypothetical protein
VPRSRAQAIKWLRRAASVRHASARCLLGALAA